MSHSRLLLPDGVKFIERIEGKALSDKCQKPLFPLRMNCGIYTLGKKGCYTPGWCVFFVIISISSVREAWQMALRCFAKCPYRAHRWDIRQGAQEGIWRYCGKLPIRGPNHHQLGPYELGTLAGSAHQVNGVPYKPLIYRVKLESRFITEDDMLPVGHCQVPPPLRPLQAETTVVGSQQGLRCGSICPVTTGQESVVNRCATSPHSVQISHPRRQGPSTQETILSDHPQQCTILPRCCLSGSPWRLAWHQRSSGSMPFEYAVDGSTSQTHTGSNSTLLNALTGKCKHLMPNTHRGWT